MRYKFEDPYLYYFISVKETSLGGISPPLNISVFKNNHLF